MKLSNELKTGVLIVAALVVLVVVLYQTGDLKVGKRGHVFKARFETAQGVKEFAPVRLAGVEVGEVKKLDILYEPDKTVIEAKLWVQDGVKLRKDSLAIVNMLGLMGEKYVEIHPGASPDFLEPGEFVASKEAISMEQLMEQLKAAGEEFQGLIKNINGVIGDNKEKLGRVMDNLEETTLYFEAFAEDVMNHPWKVLAKGKEKTPEEKEKARAELKAKKAARIAAEAAHSVGSAANAAKAAASGSAEVPVISPDPAKPAKSAGNFGPRR